MIPLKMDNNNMVMAFRGSFRGMQGILAKKEFVVAHTNSKSRRTNLNRRTNLTDQRVQRVFFSSSGSAAAAQTTAAEEATSTNVYHMTSKTVYKINDLDACRLSRENNLRLSQSPSLSIDHLILISVCLEKYI